MAKPKDGFQHQLSLTGSRSLLEQLRPKGPGNRLRRTGQSDTSNTSSEDELVGSSKEVASSRTSSESSESSRSSIEDLNHGAQASTASKFRSMLGGGRASGALALKDRLRRLRKFEDTGENLDGGEGSESKGMGLQHFGLEKASRGGSRPPMQPAERLSSGEGTQESSRGDTNIVSGDGMMSPASSNLEGYTSSPEGMTTSSSDEDGDENKYFDSAGRGTGVRGDKGRVATTKHLRSKGRPNFRASQLKNNIFRLTGRRSRQPPTPQIPSPADSSSTLSERNEGKDAEEEEEDDVEGGKRQDLASLTDSSTAAASSLGNKLSGKTQTGDRGSRDGLSKRSRDGDNGKGRKHKQSARERVIASRGGDDEVTAFSSRTGAKLQQSMLPSWPRVRSGGGWWASLDDSGGAEVASVSGVGRPAAGAIENTLYGWFGRVAGRDWPGVGLAPRPIADEEDAEQVTLTRDRA